MKHRASRSMEEKICKFSLGQSALKIKAAICDGHRSDLLMGQCWRVERVGSWTQGGGGGGWWNRTLEEGRVQR